jgi:hypothetical protein
MKTIATTAATLLATTVFFAGSAQAGAGGHMDDLAIQLKRQTSQLCRNLRFNFRYAPGYGHLYSDAYDMYSLADHIHEVVHHHGDIGHVRHDLEKLDRLFHHFEDLVAGLAFQAPVGHSGHGFHHGGIEIHYGHAGFTRRDVRRLRRVLAAVSVTLHHMQEDIDDVLAPVPYKGPVYKKGPAVIGAPVVLKYKGNGFQVKTNGKKFGFSLKF